jgi:hypothetical protein
LAVVDVLGAVVGGAVVDVAGAVVALGAVVAGVKGFGVDVEVDVCGTSLRCWRL